MSTSIDYYFNTLKTPFSEYLGLEKSRGQAGIFNDIKYAAGMSIKEVVKKEWSNFDKYYLFKGMKATFMKTSIFSKSIYIPCIPGLSLVAFSAISLVENINKFLIGSLVGVCRISMCDVDILKSEIPGILREIINHAFNLLLGALFTVPVAGAFLAFSLTLLAECVKLSVKNVIYFCKSTDELRN